MTNGADRTNARLFGPKRIALAALVIGMLAFSGAAMAAKTKLTVSFVNKGATGGVTFFGKVTNDLSSCLKNRNVTVSEGTTQIGTDKTSKKGSWQVPVPLSLNPVGAPDAAHKVTVEVDKRSHCSGANRSVTVVW